MNYEIVERKETKLAGLCVRTSNSDPAMGAKIGGMWKSFYEDGVIAALPGKVGQAAFGVYTNYENGAEGGYDAMVAMEVENTQELPSKFKSCVAPAGKYARFLIKGDVVKDVSACWGEIWGTPLNRSFTCDFEEYIGEGSPENMEIAIYVALKD